ncbi:MAG: class I SAM-dependent methyltransferase [Atribacterota bacterium]|nr:class I SAM-dependent methyltransferase [Atribacterota bacterium]
MSIVTIRLTLRKIKSYFENLLWRILTPFLPWYFSEQHFENLYRRKKDPWDYAQSPFEREKYEKTLGTIPEDVESVLEVGSSEGVFTELLLQKGKRVTGIDISETALERAKQRLQKYHGQVELRKCNIVKDDSLDITFDLILASEVLYYLGDKKILLSLEEKFFRLLNENGYLLLVHFYPSGKIIHDTFLERNRFVRIQEEVTYHPERDYIITLLQKRKLETPSIASQPSPFQNRNL